MANRLTLPVAVEIYSLIPRHERPALRPIIFQKVIAWRKANKGQNTPETEAMRHLIAEHYRQVRRETEKG